MIRVKVLTGKNRERKITYARAKESKRLIAEGWRLLYVDASLHPSEIVASVGELIALAKVNKYEKVFFISNCDHVFNKLRVLRSAGDVDQAEFLQYNINEDGSVRSELVTVTDTGECDSYPRGFLEEWNNQLLQILNAREESGASSITEKE